jgi:DNA-binding transcriptional regulator YiaG
MALPFLGDSRYLQPMSEDDFVSAAIGAINHGDLKKLFEETIKNLDKAGLPLVREALEAGIALGRADADVAAGRAAIELGPPEALDFLKFMASVPVAPEAFRTLRTDLGFSQTDVGELCGVTHSTVSEWERGVTPMPQEAIQALMRLTAKKLPEPKKPEDIISGADVRALRKKLGMRQTDLAAALGVGLSTIEKWEREPDAPLTNVMVRRIRLQFDELSARAAAA